MSVSRILKRAARSVLDRLNLAVLKHNYYSPVVFPRDIRHDLSAARPLPGLDFNIDRQLQFVRQFHFRDELLAIPLEKTEQDAFGYHNGAFESGDAEMLYNIIRHFKPRRILEIGCGQSTLMARLAQDRNRRDDA